MTEEKKVVVTYDANKTLEVPLGSSLAQVLQYLPERKPHPVAAMINNNLQELDYKLFRDSDIRWLDYRSTGGYRVYKRSMILLMLAACSRLYPQFKLEVCHSLENGIFCRLLGGEPLTPAHLKELEAAMFRLVTDDLPITCQIVSKDDAVAFFYGEGKEEKARLIELREDDTLPLYTLDGYTEYFFGKMVNRTGKLDHFAIAPFEDGFVLRMPSRIEGGNMPHKFEEPRNLFATLQEYYRFRTAVGAENADHLNQINKEGGLRELSLIDEARQERALHSLSDAIAMDFPRVRLVMIAGPSSSGKTTFTKRLGLQFRTMGIRPLAISLDDYFIDRDKTPLNAEGKADYESVEALDLELFHRNLNDLLDGQEVEIPRYDFLTGKRAPAGVPICLGDDKIILIEGIHALNPLLIENVPKDKIRCIFISAITQMKLDAYTPFSSADVRMLRRMSRDYQFRGHSAENTIMQWPSVRRGEGRNIYPYQENADYYFNSALIYELPVLRPIVEPLLKEIAPESPAYPVARQLLETLQYIMPADKADVLSNSILQEFLGMSAFSYK